MLDASGNRAFRRNKMGIIDNMKNRLGFDNGGANWDDYDDYEEYDDNVEEDYESDRRDSRGFLRREPAARSATRPSAVRRGSSQSSASSSADAPEFRDDVYDNNRELVERYTPAASVRVRSASESDASARPRYSNNAGGLVSYSEAGSYRPSQAPVFSLDAPSGGSTDGPSPFSLRSALPGAQIGSDRSASANLAYSTYPSVSHPTSYDTSTYGRNPFNSSAGMIGGVTRAAENRANPNKVAGQSLSHGSTSSSFNKDNYWGDEGGYVARNLQADQLVHSDNNSLRDLFAEKTRGSDMAVQHQNALRGDTVSFGDAHGASGDRGFADTSRGEYARPTSYGDGYDYLPAETRGFDRSSDRGGVSAYESSYRDTLAQQSTQVSMRLPRKIRVIRPQAYEDVEAVAKGFKGGDLIVLALNGTRPELARRILDFSFGVACALDGTVDCLSDRVFAIIKGAPMSEDERQQLRREGVL